MYNEIINNPYGGIILFGREGTGIVADAIDIAERIAFKTGGISRNFTENPDCHIIDLIEGKRKITLEQIEEVVQCQNMVPLYSGVNIFVIAHADCMNITVQNSLLKVLEDGANNNCFLMCCENRLIPTIMNRCCVVNAGKVLDDKKIHEIIIKENISEWSLRLACDERFEWMQDKDYYKLARKFDELIHVKKRCQILLVFEALPEKAENSPVKTMGEEMMLALIKGLFHVYSNLLIFRKEESGNFRKAEFVDALGKLYADWSDGQLIDVCTLLSSSIVKVKERIFTHNDYFNLIRKLVKELYIGCHTDVWQLFLDCIE